MALYSEVSLLKWIRKGETLGYSRTFRAPRDSLIASVPIGYEDGYRRAFSNRGRVIVKGKFAPVVGRISMDWTLVDVTDIAGVKTGDKVILMGSEDDLRITAEELAEWAGTISYEITCGINKRVRRVYVESK
jgi:alanine racemase